MCRRTCQADSSSIRHGLCYLSKFSQEQLLLPKLLYFVLNVLLYSTYTYTAKYFEEVWRISSHHFGYIIGLCTLSFTGSLIWTMVADRTGYHKLILILTTIGYAASFAALRTHAFIDRSEAIRLAFVAACYGLSNFFTSALFPLLDNRVFTLLAADARFTKELFGRQRLFGVVGQSLITILNGYSIERFGFDAIFVNLALFTAAFLLLVVAGIPGNLAEVCPEGSKGISPSAHGVVPQQPFSQAIRKLIFSFDYVFFLLIILVAGATRGVSGNYLPQYLEKSMKFSTLGLSLMLQTRIVTEIGIFFMGKSLMTWLGVHWMMFLAQITGFLRVFVYAIIPTHYPWTLVPLIAELLKGVNNACLVSAGVRYVHDFAPAGVEATAQGFFSGVHSYLANAASGFFGGFVLHMYQDDPAAFQILFAYTSVLSGAGIVLYSAKQLIQHASIIQRQKR